MADRETTSRLRETLARIGIDLYDHKVRVEFVGFLRPQVKFDGPDQLVDELKRNVEETKRLTA